MKINKNQHITKSGVIKRNPKSKRQILKSIYTNAKAMHLICNDPMNMCPGDFAEDYTKIISRLTVEAVKLGATPEEYENAYEKGIEKANEELEEMYPEEESPNNPFTTLSNTNRSR